MPPHRLSRRVRALSLAALLLGALVPAAAVAGNNDTLVAESLYQSGKQLFDQAKYAEACPKLAESQRLDPAGGTAILLATCWEKAGKIASAVIAYQDAVSFARRDRRADREKLGNERIKALDPEVPRLTVSLSPQAKAQRGVEVTRDGEPVVKEALGVELLVDPGPHVLRATAPDFEPYEARIELARRERKSAVIPALVARTTPAASASETPPLPRATAEPPPTASSPEPPPPQGSSRRTIGLVTAGAGVVLAGVGAYFGLRAAGLKDEIQGRCPAKDCDDHATVDKSKSAIRDANVANVLLPLGAVAAGVGAFLFFTSPRPAPTGSSGLTPVFGRGYTGLSLQRSF